MNCKLLIMCLIVLLCCVGCGKANEATNTECEDYTNNMESMDLIEQIFNICDCNYEIIEEKNGLSDEEYGGSYTVTLKVSKNNMTQFRQELEKHYSTPPYLEELNVKNYYGEELGGNDEFYSIMTSVKRTIETAMLVPKTCEINILCTETTNGAYIVEMKYLE